MTDVQTAAPEIAAAPVAVAPAPKFTPGKASVGGSPVKAVLPEGGKSVIRMYESGTHGYVVIQQNVLDFSNPAWPRNRKRSTLIKGTKELLELVVENMVDKKSLEMPGKLIVEEVLYTDEFRDEVEAAMDKATYVKGKYADYVAQLNLKEADEDLRLKDVLKRAGNKDAPILTQQVDGEDVWILKFTRYQNKPNPKTGQYDDDVTIQHDNFEEIAQYRADNPQDSKPE